MVGLVSVFTGLIFTLIVTRQLTQEEFGTWGLIAGLTGYVLIIRPIVNYWTTREIARGEESGQTAFLSSGLFSTIGIVIYILIIYIFTAESSINREILLFAAIIIPVEFVKSALSSISNGYKPQITEYGILASELSKIPIALFLVYFLDMGLAGAILTTSLASLASITILLIRAREKIKGKFNKKYLKKWLKLFWLPLYPNIAQIFSNTDVVIFTIITGFVGGLAYWVAAMTISNVVNHSIKISKAVYPKLLGGGKKEYFQENLTKVFYFSFPLVAMAMTFTRPALYALNPLYEIAAPVILLLAPATFFKTLGTVFRQSLKGIEKVDLNENATFKDYLKSKLFYLPTLENIQKAVYIVVLLIVMTILVSNTSDIDLIMYWGLVSLLAQIPLTIYLYVLVRKDFSPKINVRSIFKYFSASILAFGFTFVLMEKYLVYKVSIFEFLPDLILFVGLAIGGYLTLTYIIDSKTRILFKSVIKEIKNKQMR